MSTKDKIIGKHKKIINELYKDDLKEFNYTF